MKKYIILVLFLFFAGCGNQIIAEQKETIAIYEKVIAIQKEIIEVQQKTIADLELMIEYADIEKDIGYDFTK